MSGTSKKVAPQLVKVRSLGYFKDGNLAEQFAACGYPVEWKIQEEREIPEGLLKACENSGGKFERV